MMLTFSDVTNFKHGSFTKRINAINPPANNDIYKDTIHITPLVWQRCHVQQNKRKKHNDNNNNNNNNEYLRESLDGFSLLKWKMRIIKIIIIIFLMERIQL